MVRFVSVIVALVAMVNGLIYLMGFTAYWPLAEISELPYKTTLLAARLQIGAGGMRLFSVLWLLAALGFVVSGLALLFGKSSWAPLMLASVVLSLVICILDWGVAFRGALIDLALEITAQVGKVAARS